jgi:hypothetical protein
LILPIRCSVITTQLSLPVPFQQHEFISSTVLPWPRQRRRLVYTLLGIGNRTNSTALRLRTPTRLSSCRSCSLLFRLTLYFSDADYCDFFLRSRLLIGSGPSQHHVSGFGHGRVCYHSMVLQVLAFVFEAWSRQTKGKEDK